MNAIFRSGSVPGGEITLQRIISQHAVSLSGLCSEAGQTISVLDTGRWNHGDGPDFQNARVLINGKEYTGDIEIHLNSRDWFAHKHHLDSRYNRVILHLVSGSCHPTARRADGITVPGVTISERVPVWLYHQFKDGGSPLPCGTAPAKAVTAQLILASDAYFEALVQELLEYFQISRSWKDALFLRFCSILGMPANRENMLLAGKYYLIHPDNTGLPQHDIHGNEILWSKSGCRPASRPEVRWAQCVQLRRELNQIPESVFSEASALQLKKTIFNSYAPMPGSETQRVLFATGLLPGLWLFHHLKKNWTCCLQIKHTWDQIILPVAPEARQRFGDSLTGIPPVLYKATTFQYRSFCKENRCAACKIGKGV